MTEEQESVIHHDPSTVALCVECGGYNAAPDGVPSRCVMCGAGSKKLVPGPELRDIYQEGHDDE